MVRVKLSILMFNMMMKAVLDINQSLMKNQTAWIYIYFLNLIFKMSALKFIQMIP